jgi:hypothetical protein
MATGHVSHLGFSFPLDGTKKALCERAGAVIADYSSDATVCVSQLSITIHYEEERVKTAGLKYRSKQQISSNVGQFLRLKAW